MTLDEELSTHDELVRMCEFPDQGDLDYILNALRVGPWDIRCDALEALGHRGGESIQLILEHLLFETHPIARFYGQRELVDANHVSVHYFLAGRCPPKNRVHSVSLWVLGNVLHRGLSPADAREIVATIKVSPRNTVNWLKEEIIAVENGER